MISLGFIGCAHCHTPWIAGTLKRRQDARVTAVCDHATGRAEKIAHSLGCMAATRQSILEDKTVTGVLICSETSRHEQDITDAARAGKHIFVEKPLGMGAKDAFKSAMALQRAGAIFMTGYRTRSEGMFRFLRQEIRAGHFGTVTRLRYVNGHGAMLGKGFEKEHAWMEDPSQAGGGALLDLGTHALDSVLWLMGRDVAAATGLMGRAVNRAAMPSCEEFGEALIQFDSGAIGSVVGSWVDVDQPVRCTISGTEGHAAVVNGALFYKSSHVAGADGKSPWTNLLPDLPLVFDLFVDALVQNRDPDFITPAEAAQVCAVQDAILIGAESKQWKTPEKFTYINHHQKESVLCEPAAIGL